MLPAIKQSALVHVIRMVDVAMPSLDNAVTSLEHLARTLPPSQRIIGEAGLMVRPSALTGASARDFAAVNDAAMGALRHVERAEGRADMPLRGTDVHADLQRALDHLTSVEFTTDMALTGRTAVTVPTLHSQLMHARNAAADARTAAYRDMGVEHPEDVMLLPR